MSVPSPPMRRLAASDSYYTDSWPEPVSLKSVTEGAEKNESNTRQMMRSLSLNDIQSREHSSSGIGKESVVSREEMGGVASRLELLRNFFPGIADKKLQMLCRERLYRLPPQQNSVVTKVEAQTIFANPLWEVRSWAIHIQKLLDKMNADSTDTATMIAHLRHRNEQIVGGIRKGGDGLGEAEPAGGEESAWWAVRAKLKAYAVDLWRISNKVQVVVVDNLNREKIVFKRSRRAYDQSAMDSPKRLNRRFLRLMDIFCPDDCGVAIPDRLHEEMQIGVEHWIEKEFLTISDNPYFTSLLCTWDQARYSGNIALKLFLHAYGTRAKSAPPIQVRADVSRLSVERKLFPDESQVETLVIPLKVEKRGGDVPYCEISWKLVYRYIREPDTGKLALVNVESRGDVQLI